VSARAAAVVALIASVTAGASSASAATVSTPERCYSSSKPVDYVGTEFRPRRAYKVFVAGRQVGAGRTSPFGDLAGDFDAPIPAKAPAGERTFTLTVTDGVRRASTRFRTTKFGADYRPDNGDPATLRVRFFAFSFGSGLTVYLHYIAPNRKHRLTIKVGDTGGPCGTAVSPRRRIFPFRARVGTWRMQFDTVKRFDATPRRPFVILRVPVLRNR